MNEQFEQLALQAGFNLHNDLMDGHSFHHEIEKFAQLIVKECAQICQDQPNYYALKTDRDNCAVAIKEHFGVK